MKQFRMLGLVVAALSCLSSFASADCSGQILGSRVKSAMQKVASVPSRVVAAKPVRSALSRVAKASSSCSSPAASSCSAPVVSGCSAPVMSASCSSPQAVSVAESPEPSVRLVSAKVESDPAACSVEELVRSFQPVRNSIAQHKASVQASEGRMRHIGGSFGSGRYEGVGFSTVSADDAIRQCCYWGQRSPVDIGVARGSNGWYATVLYR